MTQTFNALVVRKEEDQFLVNVEQQIGRAHV